MKNRYFLVIGSFSGMLAVILGAFGAHGLENMLDARMLQRFDTGVEYQFYHSLALLLTGMLDREDQYSSIRYAGYAFLAGILLFSGSLYIYVLSGVKAVAMITPVGGTAFIVGWVFLFIFSRKINAPPKI